MALGELFDGEALGAWEVVPEGRAKECGLSWGAEADRDWRTFVTQKK